MSFENLERVQPVFFNSRHQFGVNCPHCDGFHRHGSAYRRLDDGLSYAGPRCADCGGGEYVVERVDSLPDGDTLKRLLALFFSENTGRYPVRDLVAFYEDNDVSEVMLL